MPPPLPPPPHPAPPQLLSLLPVLLLLLLLLAGCQEANGECPDVVSVPASPPLSAASLRALANASSEEQLRRLTSPILVERPVGSDAHARVRDYIVGHLRDLGWRVELDEFSQETVVGLRQFANIVATAPQAAGRWLTLAAHYDSKLMPGFVGATDSAVPCGQLLQLAAAFTRHLPASAELGLRFVFFDGEEAFVQWSAEDSIYGARHLAEVWGRSEDGDGCSRVGRTDTLLLLDLIGYRGATFHYNPHPGDQRVVAKEKSLFQRLVNAETRLRDAGLLAGGHAFFRRELRHASIEDDHLPFRALGVPVVHVIAQPFPPVWHRLDDNADAIDWPEAQAVSLVVQAWTAELLQLSP